MQTAQQLARLGFVRRPVDLHHLPRLGHAGALVVGQGEQPAARIATHPEHRVHDEMHRDVHRTENDADGIDQEGHVGRHHAHQRAVRGAGCIAVERRRQFDQRLAGLAHAPELQMRKRGRGEIRRCVHAQVVFGDAAEEVAHESGHECAPRRRGTRGVRGYLLDECQAGGGNLAEHVESRWKEGFSGARDYTCRWMPLSPPARDRAPRRDLATRAPAGRAWRDRACSVVQPDYVRTPAPWARRVRRRAGRRA